MSRYIVEASVAFASLCLCHCVTWKMISTSHSDIMAQLTLMHATQREIQKQHMFTINKNAKNLF